MEENISNALDVMLRAFNCENCKEAVIDEIAMNGWSPKQLTKTRFKFWFIGRPLGIFASTFIVELDVNKFDKLIDYVSKQHRRRFDMFEFEKYDNCCIAYD